MKAIHLVLAAGLVLTAAPLAAGAQVTPAPTMAPMNMPMPNMPMPSSSPLTDGTPPPSHNVPIVPNPTGPGWSSPVDDNPKFSYLLIDQLEYQNLGNASGTYFNAQGWTGGDIERLWFKTEGFIASSSPRDTEAEASLLYGKQVNPYFDLQAGLREVPGFGMRPARTYAVIGLEGLAPYNLDVEPSLFVSQNGKISARFEGELNVPLTQRLILQPRLETNVALQPDAAVGIGAGLNNVDLGLRLRYEIRREFAPYIGISWKQNFGQTYVFAERYGTDRVEFPVVAGLRFWF